MTWAYLATEGSEMGMIQNFPFISPRLHASSTRLGSLPKQRRQPWPWPWECRRKSCPSEARCGLLTRDHQNLPISLPYDQSCRLRRASNHNISKKKGLYGVGVGFFQSVLLVARVFDSQITAGAHLCRLCFLRRSLTPDSCVGCLPNPNAWTSSLPSLGSFLEEGF